MAAKIANISSLKIYLDITGDTIVSKKPFQPSMITGKKTQANTEYSKYSDRYSDRYSSSLYFTSNVQYSVELFKKYNINDAERALKVFYNKYKSLRLFEQFKKYTAKTSDSTTNNSKAKAIAQSITQLLPRIKKLEASQVELTTSAEEISKKLQDINNDIRNINQHYDTLHGLTKEDKEQKLEELGWKLKEKDAIEKKYSTIKNKVDSGNSKLTSLLTEKKELESKQAEMKEEVIKQGILNNKAKKKWTSELQKMRTLSTDRTITKKQLDELRDKLEENLKSDDNNTKKQISTALTYAEQDKSAAKTKCPPNCLNQNITFLLDMLFKPRKNIFLNGKKYSIAKYVYQLGNRSALTSSKTMLNIIVTLRVLDSEKSHGILSYYDCDGKKKLLQNQLMTMFPNVFDYFDVHTLPIKKRLTIDAVVKTRLLDRYRKKKREINKTKTELYKIEYALSSNSNMKISDMEKLEQVEIKINEKLDRLNSELKRQEKEMRKKKFLFEKPKNISRIVD